MLAFGRRAAVLAVAACVLSTGPPAGAVPGQPCGVADAALREPMASDALFVLEAAVGVPARCGPCLCDVDGNGRTTAGDALLVLRRAVGAPVELRCPDCTCRAAIRITGLGWNARTTAADVDADGFTDLLATDGRNTITMRRGLGRAVFDAPMTIDFAGARDTIILAVGDVTEDGTPDLVLSTRSDYRAPRRLPVLPGRADGSFDTAIVSDVSVYGGAEILDLDGDGHVDLFVGPGLLVVLAGDGTGRFEEIPDAAGPDPYGDAFALALIDEDPNGDLVVEQYAHVEIRLGNGNGTFTRGGVVFEPLSMPSLDGLAAGDIDGDGNVDLAVSGYVNYQTGLVFVMYGGGDGTFTPSEEYVDGENVDHVGLVDLDADGDSEIVAALRNDVVIVTVERGRPDARIERVDTGPSPTRFEPLDANNDGRIDLLVSVYPPLLLLGRGDGRFESELISRAAPLARSIGIGDVNEDGIDDAFANEEAGLSAYRGMGDGTFANRADVELAGVAGELVVGDFDGGGGVDALVERRLYESATTNAFHAAFVYQTYFVAGGGAGTLASPQPLEGIISNGTAFGDVDGDGRIDVAALDAGAREIAVYFALPAGDSGTIAFERGTTIRVAEPAGFLRMLDANGDGLDDVLLFDDDDETHTATRWIARTGRTFEEPQPFEPMSRPTGAAAGDLDGDGLNDLVLALPFMGNTPIHLGISPTEFARMPMTAMLGGGINEPQLADFDRDGALDLVFIGRDPFNVTLVPGDGHAGFGAPVAMVAGASEPVAIRVADIDESGFLDVLVAHFGEQDNGLYFLPDLGKCILPSMSMPMPGGGGGGD